MVEMNFKMMVEESRSETLKSRAGSNQADALDQAHKIVGPERLLHIGAR